MKISIVIPAFNEDKLLGESLAQIKSAAAAFTKLGWEFEIVVCDNNSTDRTTEIARARNSGAAAATGDWLVFVDADSHPSAELFADVAEQIVSGKCLAGGTTVRLDVRNFSGDSASWIWNRVSRLFKLLAGSFIFCETAAFRKIGGFSNELFAGEELELSGRLKHFARAQKKKVVILHRHPLTTSARKMQLYTIWDHLKLLFKVLFNRRILTQRDACILWYDGRR